MRIALVIHSLDGGGAERQMVGLADYWADRGHDITLITLDSVQNDRYRVSPSVRRVGLGAMGHSRNAWEAWRANWRRSRLVRQAVMASNPEVIVSFCDRMNIMTLTACRTLGVPMIASEHSDPRRQNLGRFWEAWRTWAYKQMRLGVALTPDVASYLHRRSGGRPYFDIPCAISLLEVCKQEDRRQVEREKIILGVGRLAPEKGWDVLLEAWASVEHQLPDWRLRIVGEGNLRNALVQQAAELDISQRVELPGWSDRVADEYEKASLYVMPSRYEGFPVALLEAMAAGMPCMVTECSQSIGMIFGENPCGGMIVKAENVSDLAAGILALCTDGRRMKEMSDAAVGQVARFAWESVGPMWDAVLSQAVSDF